MKFQEFIRNKALEDKLPFDLDIQPQPWDGPFETVGRFQLACYGELLSREAWFYEILGSTAGNRRVELQIEYFSLAKMAKEELGLESDAAALKALSEVSSDPAALPPAESESERTKREAEAEARQAFMIKHMGRFTKLNEMAQTVDDDRVVNWMKITFLLMSRYDANWGFSQSAALRPSEIQGLLKFINKEANGGVLPEELPEAEDLGKPSSDSGSLESPAGKNGARSTGQLTPAPA